ncbi:MAG TPA: hypothetical protein VHK06_03320 [Candidatus Limnocylindria bacterium]|nr:hypothetical protein [Candidatus Limnocylindria bacterium]
MNMPKPSRSLPLALITTLLLLVSLAIPASAAPAARRADRSLAADHIPPADCDEVAIDGTGNLLVGGTPVGSVTLLGDEVVAALELAAAAAAAADGEACVDVDLLGPGLISINADISVCGSATLEGKGEASVGGAVIPPDLLSADLLAVLEAAAAADVDACVFAMVDENEVSVDAAATLCVSATLGADGSLTLSVGESELVLEGATIIDTSNALEVDAEVEVALAIGASTEITGETTELTVQVVVVEGCGEDTTTSPSAAPTTTVPSAAPTGGSGATAAPTGGTGASAGPTFAAPPALPDTSVTTDRLSAMAMAVLVFLLVASAGSLAVVRVRSARRR